MEDKYMVKLDIVSGFLGAGKTTFIKKMLKLFNKEENIAIIENEFGDVSIDHELLKIEGFEVYQLQNGCVCCKLKGEFLLTLKTILKQNIDRIIFEPSGIFVLNEITDLFIDPEISSKCYLNSVITIVDARNFIKQMEGYSLFFKNQIINASVLIVSKTQFLQVDDIHLMRDMLSHLNERALIVTEIWEDFSNQHILDLIDNNPPLKLNQGQHPQEHNFDSLGIKTSENFTYDQLKVILKKCRNGDYGQIIRGKGIVLSAGTCVEFHYVEGDYTITETKECLTGIVAFIGCELQKESLREAFRN
jgi:G3E family GTPase